MSNRQQLRDMFVGTEATHKLDIKLDGQAFYLGSASGDGCHCLIDTLRQKLPGVMCSVSTVRSELERRHHGQPTEIVPGAYLPLALWDDNVDLLRFHNEVRPIRVSWAHRFRVVCIDLTWIGSGEFCPLVPLPRRTHPHSSSPV